MDPIANLLTNIRNAYMSRNDKTEAPHSKIKEEILRVLKETGFISDFKTITKNNHKILEITLSYIPSGDPILTSIKRISRPSVRIYADKNNLPFVLSGKGIAIISTSKGIMTESQARSSKLGGEIICTVS